jgi:hypothetical protein
MTQKSSAKSKKTLTRTLPLTKNSGVSSKPKVIRRPGNLKSQQETTVTNDVSIEREEVMLAEPITEQELMAPNPVTATKEEPASSPADKPQNSAPSAPTLPPIDGFDLSGMSQNQQYAIRNALVLCDCCVLATPERIFDVLGRNFGDTGSLMWWLRRIGKGPLAETLKGKDIVDAVRRAAHVLARELKEQIGKPVARW